MNKPRGVVALPPDERRTEMIGVRLTADEKAECLKAAGATPGSGWAREVLLKAARRGRKEG